MPLINAVDSFDWEDPDLVPRPVVTLGVDGLDIDALGDEAHQVHERKEADFHHHRKGQLLLWMRGLLTCQVASGFWLVPPGGAIWVPAGVEHRMETSGTIECYVVYVDPDVDASMPRECCTLATTTLLKELVIRSAALPMRYEEGGMASRLMMLLLDEMALARRGRVHLPMPADKRLVRLVEWIMTNPSDPGSIDTWSARLDISPRTLSRLVARETGLSFGAWRRQLHLLLALQWMARGATVQDVADGLGYENASNFVAMFRKALGDTPGRYLKSRV